MEPKAFDVLRLVFLLVTLGTAAFFVLAKCRAPRWLKQRKAVAFLVMYLVIIFIGVAYLYCCREESRFDGRSLGLGPLFLMLFFGPGQIIGSLIGYCTNGASSSFNPGIIVEGVTLIVYVLAGALAFRFSAKELSSEGIKRGLAGWLAFASVYVTPFPGVVLSYDRGSFNEACAITVFTLFILAILAVCFCFLARRYAPLFWVVLSLLLFGLLMPG